MQITTNWNIITGPPSSGKTTVINALSMLGFRTEPEVARTYLRYLLETAHLELNGQNGHKGDPLVQDKILKLELARERCLIPEELIFFDRGLPDCLAYYHYYQLDSTGILEKINRYRYANVFYLDSLPIVQDDIRQENTQEAQAIGQVILSTYADLGYSIIHIPVLGVEKRVEMILSYLETP